MNNRDAILQSIKENLNSGKINIVFTPKGVDSESLLLTDLKSFIEKNFENSIIFYSSGSEKQYSVELFDSVISSNKKAFLLIDDLSQFNDPNSIINTFYGNKNINVIATTSINVEKLAGKDMTDIRGRYISYFYPPYLYGDDYDTSKKSIRNMFRLYFSDYRHKENAKKLYMYVLNHSGELLTLRKIYSECGVGISLVTFINIFNYLRDSGLFYLLTRINLNDLTELDYGFVLYPCRCFDILSSEIDVDEQKRQKIYYESSLVAKVLYDNQIIHRAFHVKRGIADGKRVSIQLSDSFLIKSNNQSILLKFSFPGDNDKSLELFKEYKGNIQKMIVFYNDSGFRQDEHGIIKCGIKHVLEKGVFSYGNI